MVRSATVLSCIVPLYLFFWITSGWSFWRFAATLELAPSTIFIATTHWVVFRFATSLFFFVLVFGYYGISRIDTVRFAPILAISITALSTTLLLPFPYWFSTRVRNVSIVTTRARTVPRDNRSAGLDPKPRAIVPVTIRDHL